MSNKLIVSASPHIRSKRTVASLYIDILIALSPCVVAGIVLFGYRAAMITAITVLASIVFHRLWSLIYRQKYALDMPLMISSVIFAMLLPVTAPLYIPLFGSFVLGFAFKVLSLKFNRRYINQVIVARILVQFIWQSKMSEFVMPFTKLALFKNEGISTIIPAVSLLYGKDGANIELPGALALYFGNTAGHIGDTCVLAVLIGLLYLVLREVINWEITLSYLSTVAVFSLIFGTSPIYSLLAGGVAFASVYVATDYESSPITRRGRVLYGILLGILTVLIRLTQLTVNSFLYAILIVHLLTPLIDKLTPARILGRRKTKVLFSFQAVRKKIVSLIKNTEPSAPKISRKAAGKLTAKVMCNGFRGMAKTKYQYSGVEDCNAVANLADGPKACTYGCIGFGTCVNSCREGAISIINELAVIDKELCTGCGHCLSSCPKQVIKMMPKKAEVFILCSSCDEEEVTCEACEMGCSGCGDCLKACPKGAIAIRNNHAVINYRKCNGCGECIPACPRKIIMRKA